MKTYTFTLVVLAASLPAFGQTMKDALVKHWKTTQDFTLAVANAMPAESYNFKPVPEELSFAQLFVQVAGANQNACALASGVPRPAVPAGVDPENANVPKALVIQFLTSSFEFCQNAVASMTPEKLDAVVGTSRKMTGYEWLWSYFTHTAHHRGQAEVYLRLKGITPPTYTF
jgi:DinB superfamily